MTPPAAARIGTTAVTRAANEPSRFTYPKTCCRREVRAPGSRAPPAQANRAPVGPTRADCQQHQRAPAGWASGPGEEASAALDPRAARPDPPARATNPTTTPG